MRFPFGDGLRAEEVRLLRSAYRTACLAAGLDPSERELNMRVRIVEGLLQGLLDGVSDAGVLSQRAVAASLNSGEVAGAGFKH